MPFLMSDETMQLQAARRFFDYLASQLDAGFSIGLWDGSTIALGGDADPRFCIRIASPAVLGSIARRPTSENLAREYATGNISLHGGDFIDFATTIREKSSKRELRALNKAKLLRLALPFLRFPGHKPDLEHRYSRDETGRQQARRDNKAFIQFHYDVSNEFYSLFLDPEMQYSCGYFTDWGNSLEQAQLDKLEMICRKLQLQPGERLLDIGCGWGGLICYAARNYRVRAHGVTLSEKQYQFVREKIKRMGLEDLVSVELKDYIDVMGTYDKIASIGMFEHIGIANFPTYFRKVRSLLRDRGLVLNHSITNRTKKKRRFSPRRISREKRLLLKYIFPGSELADIGTMLQSMELTGLEVRDVEAWREHYGLTTEHWCRRLTANRDKAVERVGLERYNMWVLYLAAVSFGFKEGKMHICQAVAVKGDKQGGSGLPPTREHLYR